MEKLNSFIGSFDYIKAYHFCDIDSYNKLLEDSILIGRKFVLPEDIIPEHLIYDFAFNKKSINKGLTMFFHWSNPSYKGEIEYSDNGKYMLLELRIPKEYTKLTVYEDWCSLACDLYDNLHAEELVHSKESIEEFWDALFIDEYTEDEIQVLTPVIMSSWIVSARKSNNKWR